MSKPTSLREILENYLITAKLMTDGRPDPVATATAIAAINGLLPEKQPVVSNISNQPARVSASAYTEGFNDAINMIHRTFNGQPDNERRDV